MAVAWDVWAVAAYAEKWDTARQKPGAGGRAFGEEFQHVWPAFAHQQHVFRDKDLYVPDPSEYHGDEDSRYLYEALLSWIWAHLGTHSCGTVARLGKRPFRVNM